MLPLNMFLTKLRTVQAEEPGITYGIEVRRHGLAKCKQLVTPLPVICDIDVSYMSIITANRLSDLKCCRQCHTMGKIQQ